jgi:hypothetical protein
MKTQRYVLLVLIVGLVMFQILDVAAQGPQPPSPSPQELLCPPGVPCDMEWAYGSPPLQVPFGEKSPEGLWFVPEGARPPTETAGITPQATGGPDDFGYTWDDSVPLSWVDASGGTDTGINSSTDHVGPIDIGYWFKYYENIYTQLYISRFGFVSFNNDFIYNSQSRIPSVEKPDDVIAPHWVPTDDVNGYVRYLRGGNAPNRWFVVEWNRLESDCCDDGAEEYTFEVILHENGDIVFQYGTMAVNGSYWCHSSGIENSSGLDGLSIADFCEQVAPNHAVRIYRPAPSARAKVQPVYQGRFTHAGETVAFQVPIRNIGELGSDTYDLTPASAWPVSLYATDGITPLTDTDGDGTADTGAVAQGESATIIAKVITPVGATLGDDNVATITVRSSLDTGKSKTATLQAAIPAPFAQVFQDSGGTSDGAMSLYLAQPVGQARKRATANYFDILNMAVAEMPDGDFVYAWRNLRCLDNSCNTVVSEIEYVLLNRYGENVRGITKLIDHSRATMNIYDSSPAVAVAPNGSIGVIWYRYLYNPANFNWNYNVYYAVLSAAGVVVVPPMNLTNNSAWGYGRDPVDVPWFGAPRIAATTDNRFILAWYQDMNTASGNVSDVYYIIRNTDGAQVKPVTKFTNDTPGYDERHADPNLTQLANGRALLTWECHSEPMDVWWDICYAVLDSAGNTTKSMTNISSTSASSFNVDAVALSNGNSIIAWHEYEWEVDLYRIAYAVLDVSYGRIAGPIVLSNPAAVTGDDYISITADAAGHAILTWTDADWSYRRYLYYALVNSNGDVLTGPMIFYPMDVPSREWWFIENSYEGYGNTSYSWTPPSAVDGATAFGASRFGGPPGGDVAVTARYANHGVTLATNVVLTATLDSHLTYVSDTSGIVPTMIGENVVWNLPDLDFLDGQDFTLYIQLPADAAYGTRYPITLTLTSSGPEANVSDDTANAEVMAARQVFLPVVFRSY